MSAEGGECRFLIGGHEPAETGDVGSDYGG